MFNQARLKLTFWYFLFIVFISVSLSALYYARTSEILNLEYSRIERRLQREQEMHPFNRQPLGPLLLAQELAETKQALVNQLLLINGVTIIVFTTLGFILAGHTLRPIQEVYEEQKRFVGDAAHELNTPITALKTSLEVNLLDKKLSQSTKTILQENLADVENLEELTQSLLKLARISDAQLQFTAVSVESVIHGAIKTVKSLAQKKEITLEVKPIPDQLKVKGDRGALLELLIIFLDNAIKYSQLHTTISLRVTQQKREVTIEIKDQGIGIPKTELAKIFDRFYRVDQARSHQQNPGFGLGLAIAKKIITEHGGKLSVESRVKQGTTFTIQLPSV